MNLKPLSDECIHAFLRSAYIHRDLKAAQKYTVELFRRERVRLGLDRRVAS